jgi:sialic acid synthase SpsE
MSQIILDFGSGNTCVNNKEVIKQMYDELKKVDTGKHEIIAKWQLFEVAGENIPLTKKSFDYAYEYGNELGYKVTASIFDKESLDFLLKHEIPFVKIANNRMLDFLIYYIPKNIPLYISKSRDLFMEHKHKTIEELWCVSKYPADIKDYLELPLKNGCNISDHTIDFTLFKKFNPKIIEWHYKLDYSTGLDAGEFARTPEQLKEIL